MLQQMGRCAKSWVSSLLLGLLALSFGVWGIANVYSGSSQTNVATVGGEKSPMRCSSAIIAMSRARPPATAH